MKSIIRPALVLFILLSLICGVLYPMVVTGIGRVAFPHEAEGSMIARDGQPVGSMLIGQAFSSSRYFWSRPSATTPMPNNGASSGGSNLGQTNPALIDGIKARIDALKAADPGNNIPIPVDLVTASGSGLDPQVSLASAYYQAGCVARERKLAPEQVRAVINAHSQKQLFGFFGEARVNVLALNLELDRIN
jgi:K+-transporting ATPase ATPase C chain